MSKNEFRTTIGIIISAIIASILLYSSDAYVLHGIKYIGGFLSAIIICGYIGIKTYGHKYLDFILPITEIGACLSLWYIFGGILFFVGSICENIYRWRIDKLVICLKYLRGACFSISWWIALIGICFILYELLHKEVFPEDVF